MDVDDDGYDNAPSMNIPYSAPSMNNNFTGQGDSYISMSRNSENLDTSMDEPDYRTSNPSMRNSYAFMDQRGNTTSMNENPYSSMNENPFTSTGQIPDNNSSMNQAAENNRSMNQETAKDENEEYKNRAPESNIPVDEGAFEKANNNFWSSSSSSNLTAKSDQETSKPLWSDKDKNRREKNSSDSMSNSSRSSSSFDSESRSSSSLDSFKTSLQKLSPRKSPTKRKRSPLTRRSPAPTIAIIPQRIFTQPDDPLALSTTHAATSTRDTSLLKFPPNVPRRSASIPAPYTRDVSELKPPPNVPQRSASLTSPIDRKLVSTMSVKKSLEKEFNMSLQEPQPSVSKPSPGVAITSPIGGQRKPPPTVPKPSPGVAITSPIGGQRKPPPTVPKPFPGVAITSPIGRQRKPPPTVPKPPPSVPITSQIGEQRKPPPTVPKPPPSVPTTSPIGGQRKPPLTVANLPSSPIGGQRKSARLAAKLKKKLEEARSIPGYDKTREMMGLQRQMFNVQEKFIVPRESVESLQSGIAKKSASPVTKKRAAKHLTPQERNDQLPRRKSPRRKSSQKSKISNISQIPFDEYKTDDTLESLHQKISDV